MQKRRAHSHAGALTVGISRWPPAWRLAVQARPQWNTKAGHLCLLFRAHAHPAAYSCLPCSKGKAAEELRGAPYLVSLDEISRRTAEAWSRGATEVCMQVRAQGQGQGQGQGQPMLGLRVSGFDHSKNAHFSRG